MNKKVKLSSQVLKYGMSTSCFVDSTLSVPLGNFHVELHLVLINVDKTLGTLIPKHNYCGQTKQHMFS